MTRTTIEILKIVARSWPGWKVLVIASTSPRRPFQTVFMASRQASGRKNRRDGFVSSMTSSRMTARMMIFLIRLRVEFFFCGSSAGC